MGFPEGFFSSKTPPLLCFVCVITYFSEQGLQHGFPISTQQKSPSPHFFFLWGQSIFNEVYPREELQKKKLRETCFRWSKLLTKLLL